MNAIANIPGINIILFVLICIAQIIGGAVLPKTNGFTDPGWTVACLTIYSFSFWLMALMIKLGIPLSSLVPLMSAVIPLSLIGVGVVMFGESASIAKIGMLVTACLLVGVASKMA
jgi:multidrug transporter EmrE-like cation transporter